MTKSKLERESGKANEERAKNRSAQLARTNNVKQSKKKIIESNRAYRSLIHKLTR